MINNSYDVNLNNAECILKKDYMGYTEVINICTNETIREIPWGFIDWLSGVGITSLVLLCVLMITIPTIWFGQLLYHEVLRRKNKNA